MATATVERSYAGVEDLLRDCLVWIPDRGTGFFVAPGLILTCAHLFWKDGAISTKVIWHEQIGQAQVHSLRPRETSSGPDLALLEVTWCAPAPASAPTAAALPLPVSPTTEDQPVIHPCVMLADDANPEDEFVAYGHPDGKFVQGDVVRFKYTGPSLNKVGTEYIRVSGDNPRYGFSGSPILNLRTKEVSGVLAMTLNPNAAEGARFLPAELAFKGFPDLGEKQKAYHQQDLTWTNLLPGTQLWSDMWRHAQGSVEAFEQVFGPQANDNVPFVEREIETEFASFVTDRSSAMVIVGQSGMGKTTLIHRLLSKYGAKGHLCTVFESARLPLTVPEVERYILEKFGRKEATVREFWEKISPECVKRGKSLLIFVDAVNEYNSGRGGVAKPTDLLEKLDGMITSVFTDYPNIKFVITCRPETWRRAVDSARSRFAENKGAYYLSVRGIAHELPRFTEPELTHAYKEYQQTRDLKTLDNDLTPLVRYQLRDPLLLSLASGVYTGEKLPEDLDTGEIFDKYYQRLKKSERTIEAIISEFLLDGPEDRPHVIKRTAIVRDSHLQKRNPELYDDLDMTDPGGVGFQLKQQKVLREWTIQPEANTEENRLEIQIRFTYDRFSEFLLSNRLLQIIQQRSVAGQTLEEAAIEVVAANLIGSQQMAVVFGALRRTLFVLQKRSTNYSALLEGITRSDPRGLPLVTSVLTIIARNPGGLEVIRELFKRFERPFKMKRGVQTTKDNVQTTKSGVSTLSEGITTRFPLIDVVYRMLRNEEYRLWLAEREKEESKHLQLLDSYFQWGFRHPDKQVSDNAVLYLYFLWRGDAQFAFPDARRITQKIVAMVRRASLFSYLFHWEQTRLLRTAWSLLVILGGELSEADRSQCALETFRQMIRNLKLRRSLTFHLIRPFNILLGNHLRKALKSLGNPVNLVAIDAFFAAPNYERNLAYFERIMSFFAPEVTSAEIEKHVREISLVENGLILELLTLAISACYERQDSQGQKHCLGLLQQLFDEKDAAATTQYCASLVLYHINYFGGKATKESLDLMRRMAETILRERRGRFKLSGKEENFNIIGTYGRALYKNGRILDDGTSKGTTKLALQYAIDALQQSKQNKDFGYYHFVCENIGLLGVLIEPKQVLELISIVLNDFPADPAEPSKVPFSSEDMATAYETVLMSLANIRVIYRQEVDRFLLDELESSELYEKIVQKNPKFNLATFYSWSFEQVTFRVLTRFYGEIGRYAVDRLLKCARSRSTEAAAKGMVDGVVTRLNELSQ